MVKIRLARIGRVSLPTYRIVVSDSRRTPNSIALAEVGHYDPKTEKAVIKEDVALEWLNKGAIPSDSVKSLFKKQGIMKKFNDAKLASKKSAKEAK